MKVIITCYHFLLIFLLTNQEENVSNIIHKSTEKSLTMCQFWIREPHGGVLGAARERLRASWRILAVLRRVGQKLGRSGGRLGRLLGPSWARLGGVLERRGRNLGAS